MGDGDGLGDGGGGVDVIATGESGGGGDGGGGDGDGGDGGGNGGDGGDGGGGDGDGGGNGGDGGDGGDGGNDGGGGGGGGDGGWNCTTKDLVPCWGCLGMGPSAKEKLFPKLGASHFAPFQPSPYESVMSRVHVAPSATANGTLEVYGAPPLSVVPSEQARLQPTSLAPDPLEQVIVKKIVGVGGDGGGASGGGDKGRESLQTATSSSTR